MEIPLQQRARLERMINGALRDAINAHGPITEQNLSSTSKRVISMIKQFNRDQRSSNPPS